MARCGVADGRESVPQSPRSRGGTWIQILWRLINGNAASQFALGVVEAGHWELVMETISEVQTFIELRSEGRLVHSNEEPKGGSRKRPSILGWYRMLRVHYHWPLFQAIQFALWLAR